MEANQVNDSQTLVSEETPESQATSSTNLMNACSSTAQELKETISEVLKTRENVVIAAGDTTSELELNLSKKLADLETVVSGCYSEKATDNKTVKKMENVSKKENKTPKEGSIEKDSNKETKNEKVFQPETNLVSKETDDKNSRKQQKYSGSAKKKGDKSIDKILKSLSNCSTTEEKLQTLCQRLLETQEELRMIDPRMKQLERQVQNQLREKEQLQTDYNRMVLAKSKLEILCRELQRQNKAVKEENLACIKEEEERRKEIATSFQATLNGISNLMQDHSKDNIQLREQNSELAKKMKTLVDHYNMWEKQMEKVVHQSNLEAELAKAQHAKVNLLLKQETEKFFREKQSLLETISKLKKKFIQSTSNELKLQTELGNYAAKYEEFHTVIDESNQVFSSFKTDLDANSKKMKKLEKETNTYKNKWESSNKALLEMAIDKQNHDKELAKAQQRITLLEKLCRALQAERNDLQNQENAVGGLAHPNEKDPTQA